MKPEVSVIIPAYNAAGYIGEAISSVQKQTFKDWELIIVDDCSTDSTCSIVESVMESDPRIRLMRNNRNSGGALAPRMKGVAAASAETVVALDADDLLNSDYLEQMIDRRKATGAELIFASLSFLYDDGHTEHYLPLSGFDVSAIYSGRDLVIETLDGWKIGASGALMPRDLITGLYNQFVEDGHRIDYPFSDEMFTRIMLSEFQCVAFCDRAVYYYRMHPDSVTHKVNEAFYSRFDLFLELVSWTHKIFGEKSAEYFLAHKMNILGMIEAMRMLNSNKSKQVRLRALELIERNYLIIDWKIAAKVVSRLYVRVLKFGPSISGIIFRCHQRCVALFK